MPPKKKVSLPVKEEQAPKTRKSSKSTIKPKSGPISEENATKPTTLAPKPAIKAAKITKVKAEQIKQQVLESEDSDDDEQSPQVVTMDDSDDNTNSDDTDDESVKNNTKLNKNDVKNKKNTKQEQTPPEQQEQSQPQVETTPKQTTISDLMNSQRQPQVQNKLDSLANIDIEFGMDDIDTLANHFGDVFVSMVYDSMSESVMKKLLQIDSKHNSQNTIMREHNPHYHKQMFKGFRSGQQDFDASLTLNSQKNDQEFKINSSMISQKSHKDYSLNIDNIVDEVDLVGDYFGARYANKKEFRRRKNNKKPQNSGKMWFDMPKTKLTKENMQTWTILQNKGQLTNNGQFIRVEKSSLPEYSQFGTFVGGGLGQEISKKNKKRTLAQEFLDDMKQNTSVKKRFQSYHQGKQAEYGTGKQYSGVKRKYKK
jgi:hypothetical protein